MKQKWKKELLFWGGFLLLNFLLFVPAYVANLNRSSFFPIQDLLANGSPILMAKALLYNRPNQDIFRWSIEFSLLLFVFFGWKKGKRIYGVGLFVLYWILLVYQIYHQAFYTLYQTPPFFYNDWGLLKVGWNIVLYDFKFLHLMALVGVLGLAWLTYRLLSALLQTIQSHAFSRLSLGIILFLCLESLLLLFRWGYRAWPEHVPQFLTASIVKNIQESLQAQRQMQEMDIPALAAHRPYDSLQLVRKPNLFFLFVESYGRLVYDDPKIAALHQAAVLRLENRLREGAWHSRSILSTAPVSGGASWVSYSTFLDGFDFRNRGTYWALLQDDDFAQYQHLPRLLQSKGYRNYRLSSIGGSEDMEIPWDTYTRFYAVDEWIRFEEFAYRGLLYGWGPSPPDQFSLHFANERLRRQQQGDPFTLFFITQNSHNPFVSPTSVSEDWRQLNDSTVNQATESRIFEPPVLDNYISAIEYQLDFITHFITTAGQANDIFIICGDHQPPLFPQPGAGFETPLHLVAKDSAFIHALAAQDFSPGLLIRDTSATIKHEGFYSLFLHHLLQHYGDHTQIPPPYLPNGHQF